MEKVDAKRATVLNTLLPQKLSVHTELKTNALTRTLKSCKLFYSAALCPQHNGTCRSVQCLHNESLSEHSDHTNGEQDERFHYNIDLNNKTAVVDETCPNYIVSDNVTIIENPYAIFKWDEATQGFILSAFYYGYATTQFLGGYLAERYGSKWVLGLGLLSTALFTFLTPWVVRAGGATWLFVLRVIEGMGEGPTMPALMLMLSNWVPPHERSLQCALVFGGAQIGNVMGSFITGLLLSGGRDWAYVFFFYGGFGLLWFVLWSIFCYSSPNTHPFISKKELDYLDENIIKSDNTGKDPVPWKAIMRSAPVWALIFAAVGHDWGYFTIVSDLPKYSIDVLKYDVAQTGWLTALPYVAMWICSFIFGIACDLCVKKGWHNIKTGRSIYTTIAATGPAICIILASYAGCDRNAAMVYFIVSMALMAGFYAGMKVNALDLAPNYAASVTSLVNTTSTFTGMITPFLIGLLTPNSTISEWRTAFWVCFAVLVSTNVVYCIWLDGEQQWWDDVRKYGYPSGWTHGPLLKETKLERPQRPDSIKISEEDDDNGVY